ncbi:hypothetical protein WMY93_032186 [Mugilogobius chulae]|uniref:G-protein coupled receptors family 1 profile domain-containing protein n=1 Tax=Mugilogobius chulae TaxID=88201 RepID=A0AAW0MK02_9GOBI
MENFTTTTSSTASALNSSECYPIDSDIRRRAFIFFYLVIILASIPLNSFFLYVSWQHIRQKNELGVYLFNLALCDLTFTVGLSLWLDFLWRGSWSYGGLSCVISIYCLYTNFYTSEGLLCCVALDRYLAVVHPLKYNFVRKVSTAVGVSFAVWVLALIFNTVTISSEDNNGDDASLCFDILLPLTANMAHANVLRHLQSSSNQSGDAEARVEAHREVARHGYSVSRDLLRSGSFTDAGAHVVKDCKTVQSLLYPHKIAIAVSCLNCLADPLLYCFITRTGRAKLHQVVLFFQSRKKIVEEGETVTVPVQTNPGTGNEMDSSPQLTMVTF